MPHRARRRARSVLVAAPLVTLALVVLPPLFASVSLHRWLHLLTPWVVLTALPGALLFPLMYGTAPWWRSVLGIGVMVQSIGIGGIVVLSSIRLVHDLPNLEATFAGDPIEVDLVRLVVYLWLWAGIYFMLAALVKIRRDDTRNVREGDVRTAAGVASQS